MAIIIKNSIYSTNVLVIKYLTILSLLRITEGIPIVKENFPIYWQSPEEHSKYGVYENAAAASDSEVCSRIAVDIMKEQGGSVVDAGIAALICNGVHDQAHMGIGGGSVMQIYESPKSGGPKEMISLNGDVRIPQWMANWDYDSDNFFISANQVLVPGELAGYHWAWKRYGRLPWADLFKPAIKLAREGFRFSKIMAKVSRDNWEENIMNSPGLVFFRKKLPNNTYVPYSEGDILTDEKLATSLEIIASEGAKSFYKGRMADMLLQDMAQYGIKITKEDLYVYRVRKMNTVSLDFKGGEYTLHAPGNPMYGEMIVFIIQIMEAFNMPKEELKTKEGIALFYHRYMEAWKFTIYYKKCIGENFENIKECPDVLTRLTNKYHALEVMAMIKDNTTLDEEKYDLFSLDRDFQEDHGTSHLSVLSPSGSAMAVTSTISMTFGAKIKGSGTGVVFNNRLFSFNYDKSVATAHDIVPGSTGYSLRVPTIVTDKQGKVVLIIGTSGGARIASGVVLNLILHLIYDLDLHDAIDYPKVAPRSKFNPFQYMRDDMDEDVVKRLEQRGQVLSMYYESSNPKDYVSVTQGISTVKCEISGNYGDRKCIEAVSDFRKGGAPYGF